MFTGAVLLVSLMIFNGQKDESNTRVTANPDIEHITLTAEIASPQIASTSVSSYWRNSGILSEPVSDYLQYLEYLNFVEHQIRLKAQMQIHQELKPGINIQSGQLLHYRPRYDDPPVS